jgi:two-component system OmpR family sensor kinase
LDALIENAVKHTAPGDVIRLASRRRGDQVAIIVVDSGTGMPADRLATIFERFARLDDSRSRDRGGTGLGLAIVKAIAQAHGGTVQVKSAVGTGSAFEILLPLEPRPDPISAHRGVVAGQRLQETWLRG